MVHAIKACGGDIRFTVYPEIGHSADPAYADPQLYQWQLDHRRSGCPQKRIRDQTPTGNAEPTLRHQVRDFSAGTPDYSQMTSTLAAASRQHAEKIQAQLVALGTLNALRYRGTEKDGSDVYDAEFANGQAQFRLLFQEDGKIAAACFDVGLEAARRTRTGMISNIAANTGDVAIRNMNRVRTRASATLTGT